MEGNFKYVGSKKKNEKLKEQIQITERINMLQSMTLCGVHMS